MTTSSAFPEPPVPDERVGLRGETRWEFLHRSTWRRAVETRAFYNQALAALPVECRKPILDALRAANTEAATFEMVVGRFLQQCGAISLEHEPATGDRRVDWRATFPDGLVVHVEAMVPIYNATSGETARRHQRLLAFLEKRVPEGWWLMPFQLPALEGHASIRPFRELAEDLIAKVPAAETVPPDTKLRIRGELPEGPVDFTFYRATGVGGLGGEAMLSHFDNSETVVRAAWKDRRKRSQGRSAPPPALLAMAGGFLGADLEAFEMALFGRDVRLGRDADGAMATDQAPPWAGVLAFPRVSPAGADDPVLFVAPAFTGQFPDAIMMRLEVRRLAANGVETSPAKDSGVMAGMRWASADD